MSKIEKALAKARQDKGFALVRTTTTAKSAPDHTQALSTVSEPPGIESMGGESPASASESIVRMREPEIRDRNELAKSGIIYPEMAGNDTVQAFREIRTKILQRTGGRNGVIMVTSAVTGGGGTFVSLNLGAAFAFDAGKTALLIDCNLRKPWLHRLVVSDAPLGLMDYLENPNLDPTEIIHPVGIERVRVIPAGHRQDVRTEYFTSPRFKRFFSDLRERYHDRFVLLDAPPISETADTKILADLCDYILLVVPYGRITNAQMEASIKSFDKAKFLGVVFNDEPHLLSFSLGMFIEESMCLFKKMLGSARSAIARLVRVRKSSGSA